jgi:hypothetical protein
MAVWAKRCSRVNLSAATGTHSPSQQVDQCSGQGRVGGGGLHGPVDSLLDDLQPIAHALKQALMGADTRTWSKQ